MNKYSKAGLLIVTLVIPALIFVFLRFFATNHYGVPFYHPLTDASGKANINNQGDTLFYSIKGIKANSLDGKPFSDSILIGKLTVVSYLTERCDDSCQIMLDNLERIYELRSSINYLNLLTILDDKADRSSYENHLKGKTGWLFVKSISSDSNVMVNDVLKLQTKIPGSKTNSSGNRLVLIDEDAHIRGYYYGAEADEVDRLMAEIKILDFEKKEALKK